MNLRHIIRNEENGLWQMSYQLGRNSAAGLISKTQWQNGGLEGLAFTLWKFVSYDKVCGFPGVTLMLATVVGTSSQTHAVTLYTSHIHWPPVVQGCLKISYICYPNNYKCFETNIFLGLAHLVHQIAYQSTAKRVTIQKVSLTPDSCGWWNFVFLWTWS